MTAQPTKTRIRYSKSEAAEMLSISVRTLDKLRVRGDLIGRADGGRIFFDHSELESYARSRPAVGSDE